MDGKSVVLGRETEFFSMVSKGNRKAFSEVYDHFEPRLFAFVCKMTRSKVAAEEIVQELFIKLWITRKKLAEVENPRAYVFTMAANLTFNYLKKVAREVALAKRVRKRSPTFSNATEEIILFLESQKLVMDVVKQMPAQRKAVYLMSREGGLSKEEIARKMNLSPNTVRNHLSEALHTLRKLFGMSALLLCLRAI
ncbi:MAG: RNA polymerase sigma-70 factor [Cyclobacteriaceae bacterium]|nr:RNA polymerase sigma-70 factor [Cyclobacteriaceae bacterium]